MIPSVKTAPVSPTLISIINSCYQNHNKTSQKIFAKTTIIFCGSINRTKILELLIFPAHGFSNLKYSDFFKVSGLNPLSNWNLGKNVFENVTKEGNEQPTSSTPLPKLQTSSRLQLRDFRDAETILA